MFQPGDECDAVSGRNPGIGNGVGGEIVSKKKMCPPDLKSGGSTRSGKKISIATCRGRIRIDFNNN